MKSHIANVVAWCAVLHRGHPVWGAVAADIDAAGDVHLREGESLVRSELGSKPVQVYTSAEGKVDIIKHETHERKKEEPAEVAFRDLSKEPTVPPQAAAVAFRDFSKEPAVPLQLPKVAFRDLSKEPAVPVQHAKPPAPLQPAAVAFRDLSKEALVVDPYSHWPTILSTGDTGCGYNMSGIDNEMLRATLNKTSADRSASPWPQLAQLQSRSYFIAACLHMSEEVLPHWIAELLRLIKSVADSVAYDNIFVSIYESGSHDRTREYLDILKGYFSFLGVSNSIIYGNLTLGNANRIDFLSKVRNIALEPLYHSEQIYDSVLWLNDVYFCTEGVLQMAYYQLPVFTGGLGADAVCGMDLYQVNHWRGGKACNFYDTWAARDITGAPFAHTTPYVSNTYDEEERESKHPFQVFSCWNGMAIFAADLFQVQQLLFRRNRQNINECAAGEAELFMRDMWQVGRGKIVVSPQSATAYTGGEFNDCARNRQPSAFHHGEAVEFQTLPREVACCPLRETAVLVNWTDCYHEEWDNTYMDVPRRSLLYAERAFQGDGDLTVALPPSLGGEVPLAGLRRPLVLGIAAFIIGVMTQRFRDFLISQPLAKTLILWGCSSVAMSFVDKLVVTVMPLPLTLLSIQMIIAISLSPLLLGGQELFAELAEKSDLIIHRAALAVPLAGMLTTGMVALDECSVTTLLMVRNALPLLAIFVEGSFSPLDSLPVSRETLLALLTTALGTTIYATAGDFGDYRIPLSGLTLGCLLLNMLFAVGHRVYERRLLLDPRMTFSSGAVVVLNNIIGVLIVVPLLLLRGEHKQWSQWATSLHQQRGYDPATACCILLSGCAGVLLSYFGIVLQKQISTTSMLSLQTAVRIFTITLALFLFNDDINPVTGLGCAVSLAGSAWYGKIVASANEDGLQTQKVPMRGAVYGAVAN